MIAAKRIPFLHRMSLLVWCGGTVVIAINGSAHAEWSGIVSERTSYTTDAFQFSAARRLRLSEDPSQPTVVPLDKPEDVIWEPAVEAIHSSPVTFGKNELSAKAQGAIYTNNPAFNHGNYRVQDRMSFGNGTSVLLRYRYQPNLLLGPNVERQTGTASIQEERVTSHIWRMELEQRLNQDITAALIGRYGLRLYNEAFAERDTHFYTVGPRVRYQAASAVGLTIAFLYERGLADGRNEPQLSDDVSYRLYLLSFETELRLANRTMLELGFIYTRKDFTSELTGDTHVGRKDRTHQG
ncbi:MAG TPA: hypothetical protein VFX36_05870, partial [Nitrospira sp.]|nr:hypothetical protein [Nitrospira sp.]